MIAIPAAPLSIDFHSLGLGKRQALIDDVRAGLTKSPKELAPRWFYDDDGSQLFEQITELPEYYQTRTEAGILRQYAGDIVYQTLPNAIVELGSGASTKTRLLIDAALQRGPLQWFVPLDVSAAIVEQSAIELLQQHPGLNIRAVIGDFTEHLDRIPRLGRQLVVFLGSTMGNFFPDQRQRFLAGVRAMLQPGDSFLLGIDLVKDETTLVPAYQDSAGVTAAFNLNVLHVINRELKADFDVEAFRHLARFNRVLQRIEMHLESLRPQTVRIADAGLTVQFEAGETIMTEISAKFTRERIEQIFAEAGLRLAAWYTDERQWFAEALAVPEEG